MKILNDRRKKRIRIAFSFARLILLLAIIIALPLYVYFTEPELVEQFDSLEEINHLLEEYETASFFVYIGLQIFQIVVSILPGQALQFAAGYVYGFWKGLLLSLAGVTLGTVITFYLARLLGRDALHIVFGEERFSKFIHTLNSKRSFVVLFVIFLIPGIPKDIVTYAAGVSELRVTAFLILSMVGRTPAMIGSILMGSMFYNGSYFGLTVLIVIAVALFIVGITHSDKLIKWIDKAYKRMIGDT